jgi:hypothetical protein
MTIIIVLNNPIVGQQIISSSENAFAIPLAPSEPFRSKKHGVLDMGTIVSVPENPALKTVNVMI